jgi:hypothetical protein
VNDQGSRDGLAGGAVVPDRGGQGEQALRDADGHPGHAAAAVQLQVQLALEGVVDRFDELADRCQQLLAGTGCAVAVGRAHQLHTAGVQAVIEFGGGLAPVGDQQQPRSGGEQMGVVVEHGHEHLAFVELGCASAQVIGSPAGVQTRSSRSPQK